MLFASPVVPIIVLSTKNNETWYVIFYFGKENVPDKARHALHTQRVL